LVPSAKVVALLVNQSSSQGQGQKQDIEKAAREVGQRLVILEGSSDQEIDASYASLAKQNVGALIVGADPFFDPRRDRMIALSARYAVPTIYQFREFVLAGGLVSYGASITDYYRQIGVYVGRVLKGESPADLPVMLPTKFELSINLKTAKALGLAIPSGLLAIVDEVIE
ncbi:MAG: ABC transporter substrate-binding protein, partial [Pseudolabrys sp.]